MSVALPHDRMPEAEVALRLATYLLRARVIGPRIEVGIDGAQVSVAGVEVFPIAAFLAAEGWVQRSQRGRNPWGGAYESELGNLVVHSQSGVGDVAGPYGAGRLLVECKKGNLLPKPGSPERPLLTTALGQALTSSVSTDDLLAVAVPKTDAFARLAAVWRERPLVRRSGIQIWLVGRDGSVEGCEL